MKNLVLLLVLIAISQSMVYSQGCLPEGITFFAQEEVDNFQINYPGCTEIEGDMEIGIEEVGGEVIDLTPLNVLTYIHGDLRIWWNYPLQTLTGLENLDSIGGALLISYNDFLINTGGLENLESIGGDLKITNNPELGNIEGLCHLKSISGGLYIYGNPSLYSLAGLTDLESIGTDIIIWYTTLTNLLGLENISSINGYLNLNQNLSLQNLTAFENLTFVGGGVYIVNCGDLINLSGLENLTTIGGNMDVTFNNSLDNLSGLNNLSSIGGNLRIAQNYALTDLTDLENLTSIGGEIEFWQNIVLNNLNGLENIEPNSISNLSISYNTALYDCDVLSICEYLLNPNGTINIHDNAPGCNSSEEVLLACETAIDENKIEELTLFPNPANSFITINIKEGIAIEETIIYNHLGQKALVAVPVNNTVDVSKLTPGIYFIEVATKDWRGRTKLIVE